MTTNNFHPGNMALICTRCGQPFLICEDGQVGSNVQVSADRMVIATCTNSLCHQVARYPIGMIRRDITTARLLHHS